MLNSLQEGILVIKEHIKKPLEGVVQETSHQIFFVNDIGNRILQKNFKNKKCKNNDHLINKERVTELKIFYDYKTAQKSSFNA